MHVGYLASPLFEIRSCPSVILSLNHPLMYPPQPCLSYLFISCFPCTTALFLLAAAKPTQTMFVRRGLASVCSHAILFVALLLALLGVASALTETVRITNDARSAILLRSFGFRAGGFLNVTLTKHTLAVPATTIDEQKNREVYELALMVERSDAPAAVDALASDVCLHRTAMDQSSKVTLLNRKMWDRVSYTATITEPGYYHIYYSNCEPSSLASFTASVSEYNLAPRSGTRNYLSVGLEELPRLYAVFFAIFALELVLWVWTLVRNKADVKMMHVLMGTVLLFKVLAVLFEAFKYDVLASTGHNNGWAIAYYVFNTIRALLMFAVIVLAGTGWSYLKPFLTNRDKQFILAVLVVQIMVNAAWIVIQVTEPAYAGWGTWRAVFYLMDLVCGMIILLPIYWSIQHLYQEAETDDKASTSLTRLRNFRLFYLTVIAYLYVSRLVTFLIESSVPYSLQWLSHVFAETSAIGFFFVVGYLFRPQPLNPYLALEIADEENGTELMSFSKQSIASAKSSTAGGVVGSSKQRGPGGKDLESGLPVPASADDDFDDEPLTDVDGGGYGHPQGALGGGVPGDDLDM